MTVYGGIMSEGWISIHRKILEWEWYSDINVCRVFIHCLIKANHTDKKWQGVTIKRGQFITSLGTLSIETSLSVQQVRTAISKLKSTSELTSKTTNKYTVISITNYEKFQDDNKQPNKRATNEQQTNNKQITTTNNDNNNNNDNNKKTKVKKVSLPELSVNHVKDWLVKKRMQGKYTHHNEHDILETFKNYCESKGKTYENYIAAYRNAFEWDRCQPKAAEKLSKHKRARIALGLDKEQSETPEPVDVTPANMF